MRKAHHQYLPSLRGPVSSRKRRYLAAVFALLFGLGADRALGRPIPFGSPALLTGSAGSPERIVTADIDGDGDLDALLASSGDDEISWFENTDGAGSFGTAQTIASLDGARSVHVADLDGDGDLDVIGATTLAAATDKVLWYENSLGDASTWIAHAVSTTGATEVVAVDVDGDGDLDLLGAHSGGVVGWHENDGSGTFSALDTISTSASSLRSIAGADLDGDGDLDALAATSDGIAWYRNTNGDGSAWTADNVAAGLTDSRAARAADFDRDGDLDVLAVDGASGGRIRWYENASASGDGSLWAPRTISTALATARDAFAVDVDGDGDLDALSASAFDDKIAWYENLGGNDGSCDPATPLCFGAQSPISSAADYAVAVFADDIDGDGDTDVLAASVLDGEVAWYENQIVHRSATFGQTITVNATAANRSTARAADLDGDGDLDTVAVSSDPSELVWYENLGGGAHGLANVISVDATSSSPLVVADIDGDGDLDLATSTQNTSEPEDPYEISWHENTSGDGAAWTHHLVASFPSPVVSIEAVDLDVDGDLDLLLAIGERVTGSSRVSWLDNTDGQGAFGSEQTIVSQPDENPFAVVSGDIDGDGDPDVVASFSDFVDSGVPLAWYENLDGATSFGAATTIPYDRKVSSLATVDLDRDGDLDVLAKGLISIRRFENTDGAGTFSSAQIFPSFVSLFPLLLASDLDQDGDLDLAADGEYWYENRVSSWRARAIGIPKLPIFNFFSLATGDVDSDGDIDLQIVALTDAVNPIQWLLNQGGQFALPTGFLGQSPLLPSTTATVLVIDFAHRGRTGDSEAELLTLELSIEDGAGAPLSSAQANAQIDRLDLFLDDGDNVRNGADSLVEQVTSFDLVAGVETVQLPTGAAAHRATPTTPLRFFLDVSLTAALDSFEIRHLTESSSTAGDAEAGLALVMEFHPDTGTGRIDTDINVSGAVCGAPFELDLAGFTFTTTRTCEAGTVIDAGGASVGASGHLTLQAGQAVELGANFSVAAGGRLAIEIDSTLEP